VDVTPSFLLASVTALVALVAWAVRVEARVTSHSEKHVQTEEKLKDITCASLTRCGPTCATFANASTRLRRSVMLTAEQQQAIANGIIEREGGLSDHPADPGGLTKFGISRRAYPHLDIERLTRAQAQALYVRDYIRAFKLHELSNVQNAEILADAFVNGFPVKRLQRLLRVTPDGTIGPQTLQAMDAASAKQLLDWRLDWYVQVAGHPFLAGWVNRLRKLGL